MTNPVAWKRPSADSAPVSPTFNNADAGAHELLAPPPAALPAMPPAFPPAASESSPEDAFKRALADGTIPVFLDQPADVASDANAPPLDPEAERDAWQALIDFIGQHKDEGTEVTIADPDTFMRNIV